jgi:outer membrane immunogenic protein
VGYLFTPSVLVYGIGGVAYGDVTLNESFIANESLGPTSFPAITAKHNWTKTRIGWTAGAGVEWMFESQWSAKIEYSYYDLGTVKSNFALNQINNVGVQPTLWASANVRSSAWFTAGTLLAGLNYYFA